VLPVDHRHAVGEHVALDAIDDDLRERSSGYRKCQCGG
jgi:hypothetical protein